MKNRKVRFYVCSIGVSLKLRHSQARTKFSSHRTWRLNGRMKGALAFALVIIVLVSVIAFLPEENKSESNGPKNNDAPMASPDPNPQISATQPPNPLAQIASTVQGFFDSSNRSPLLGYVGTFTSAEVMDSRVWQQVAKVAWRYFTPGMGVNGATGLPASSDGAPYFTDWDLGVYIQAIMDAQTTGAVVADGEWGSSARLERVVSFLENRELNQATGYPFWFYQSSDGKNYNENSNQATGSVDTIDTGRLLVALNNLRTFNSSLAPRINAIVIGPGNRSDYAALVPEIKADSFKSKSTYAYYIASGFAGFWPNELSGAPNRILNNIMSSGTVTTKNVSLPLAEVSCDPLLCSIFETSNNSQLVALAKQVYLAHEGYFNDTGSYRAFSEGGATSGTWLYEWVVLPDGRTWTVLYGDGSDANIPPVTYTKVAVGFLAISNTSFAKDMVVYIEQSFPEPTKGYWEGIDEKGTQLFGLTVHTNGLILGAAKYAISRS